MKVFDSKTKNYLLEKNNRFFDTYARKYMSTDLLKFDRAAQYEFDHAIRLIDLTSKRSIIDLGCGIGKYSLALAARGHQVTAVDISPESLRLVRNQAKKHKLKNITTLNNDFTSPVTTDSYDVGLCVSSFHMVSDSEKGRMNILANFIKSIKPGGTLLLVEPNPLNPLLYLFYMFYPGVPRNNIRTFLGSSPFRLRSNLKKLGMKSLEIHYVGFLPLRFLKKVPQVAYFNEFINRIPGLNIFSAFSYIKAIK